MVEPWSVRCVCAGLSRHADFTSTRTMHTSDVTPPLSCFESNSKHKGDRGINARCSAPKSSRRGARGLWLRGISTAVMPWPRAFSIIYNDLGGSVACIEPIVTKWITWWAPL